MKTISISILTTLKQLAIITKKSVKTIEQILKKYRIEKRENLLYREIEKVNIGEKWGLKIEPNLKCKLLHEVIEYKKEYVNKRFSIGFVGHIGHGKTTIITNIINRPIHESHDITQNAHIYNEKEFDIVDTPGHSFFGYIRRNIIDIVDIIFLVIDLEKGIEFETEDIIKYLKVNNYISKTIAVFNKSDRSKDVDKDTKALRKNLASKLGITESETEYIVVNKNMNIKKVITETLELCDILYPNDKLTIVSNDMNSIVARVNYEHIQDEGYIFIDSRAYKIKSIIVDKVKTKKVDSRQVCRIVLANNIAGNVNKVVYADTAEHADSYQIYSSYIRSLNHVPKTETASDTKLSRSILIVAPDYNLIQNIREKVDTSYIKIAGAFTTLDIHNVKIIDRDTEVIVFNTEISSEIKKELDNRKIKYSSYTNIYNLIEYIDKICTTYKYPASSKNVAEIIQIFKLKDGTIIGCLVILGKFSMGDQVQTVAEDNEILNIQLISLKKETNLIKQANAGDKFGTSIKGPVHKIKVGMFIYN